MRQRVTTGAGGVGITGPLFLLLILLLLPEGTHARKKIDVFVAGFFPVGQGPKHSLGRGVMPALNLAVKHVNEHPTVLRNYKLHVIWNDTECDTAVGTKLFFDMMYKKPLKLMLFGAACTHVTNPIAKAAKHWHIVQLSYADTHPMFSAIKYPNFFRMAPSDKEFNHPRIHLLQRFNWTRIGTLFQNEPRHALAHNHLLSLLKNDFEIAYTQNIIDDLKEMDQLKKLYQKDVRVILGYFDEHWARRIFCEAYRKGMYGKNYQWIITGMYREEWWDLPGSEEEMDFEDEPQESGGGGCAVEDIMAALEGCIMTDLLPLATSLTKTVSGKNISEYERDYNTHRRTEYSRFHGYTYDGVWAMALAIQAVGHKLHRINHHNKTNITVQDFSYRNPVWEELFTKALSEVKYEGVTGPVQFNKDNTRKGYILLKQFQGGREVKIGEYDGFENVLQLDKGHPIYWPGGDPPLDRTVKLIEKTSVNIGIYAILVTIASMGIVMASVFLGINISKRNQRYIKMSSPYLNNVIIVGCILTYSSVILLGLDSGLTSETSFPYICTARAWVLMAGFTLAFGSMFSKTWRVHSIFTDVQLNKKVIKDSQLFLVVFVLLCVDVAIMTTWQIVDPFYRETKHLVPYMRGDILVIPENEYCKSSKISVFVGCIYAYKGLLMVCGCFLAWETRQVNIPALNDSKYIGMSVYNVVIMCVIGVPISYILSDEQDASYLIISIFILFCTTGTLCLVFVPKIIELRRNPKGSMENRGVRPTLKPPKNPDSDSELSDFHDQIKKAESDRQVFVRKLREREQDLKVLIEQLGEDALGEVEGQVTRTTRRSSKPRSIEKLRIEVPSVTETTEATELTSLCSGTSQEGEYVKSRTRVTTSVTPSCTTTITTSSTISSQQQHQQQQHHHHHYYVHQHHQQQHQLPPSSGVVSASLSLDRAALRRGVTFASPVQTPRDSTKGVSFRMEGSGGGEKWIGGGGGGCPTTVEAIPMLHISASTPHPPPHLSSAQPMPMSSVHHQQQQQQPTHPSMPPSSQPLPIGPYQDPLMEREGSTTYGGYGGVYVHEYGGSLMQKEKAVLSQRRASRTSLQGSCRYSRDEVDVGPPLENAPPPPTMMEYDAPYPEMMGGVRPPGVHGDSCPYRRTSLRQSSTKYCPVPRNLYTPLNNEDSGEKLGLCGGPKKSADIKIINNKASYQAAMTEKNSNVIANLAAGYNISGDGSTGYRGAPRDPGPRQPDQVVLDQLQPVRSPASRRGSEPPRPPGRGPMHMRNRSCDDLACSCCEVPLPHDLVMDHTYDPGHPHDGDCRGHWVTVEDRDGTRTISRAHLRRDSFGEVVSRRSPSQDSLEHGCACSPTIMLDDPTPAATPTPTPPPRLGRHSPGQDSYGYGIPRRSDSQDSLDHQVDRRGRVASQESLGTMSMGSGSIYSVTSARSDAAVSRCSSKETVRNHAPLTQQTLPHARTSRPHPAFMNEPTSLHRTSSDPYYNFDDEDSDISRQQNLATMPQQQTHQREHLRQQQEQQHRGGGGRTHLPPVRTPSYDNNTFDTSSLYSTHSLRGRGRHATTSTVAAAIVAARKNASDNALDHDTSILPIFQKLLSERQRGYHGARDFTMSSCPNITIKCDIVEYL